MRQKDGAEVVDRSRPTSSSSFDRNTDMDLSIFITFLRQLPRSIQRKLQPIMLALRNDYSNDERVKDVVASLYAGNETSVPTSQSIESLVRVIGNMLQLNSLTPLLIRITDRIEAERAKNGVIKKTDVGVKKSQERLDLLHPEYQTYYRMSKQDGSHPLHDYHVKIKDRHFYAEPRFLVKLEELNHYQNNQKHRGNILYLNYQGSIIRGRKCYAVANGSAIQIWQKVTEEPPTVVIFQEIIPEGQESKREKKEDPVDNGKFELAHRLIGHTGKITSLSFTQDEYFLISCGVDKTVKLWEMRTMTLLQEFKTHTKTVWDIDFSASGYYFISGGADGLMILWKTDVPNPQRIYNHKLDVYKVRFAKDPSFVISAGEDCTMKIWKTFEAELVKEFKFNNPVINISLSFSGVYLAVAETDGRITLIDKGEVVNFFSIEEPQGKKHQQKSRGPGMLMIHDMCFSEDEDEFTVVSSRHVMIYSLDRLEMKIAKNIYSLFDGTEGQKTNKMVPKEVISMGIDTNLTFCSYQYRNLLVIGGTKRKI